MSTTPADPPRLTELSSDAPSELRSLFEFARRDVPNDAALAELASRVGPILGPASGSSGPDVSGGSGAPPGGTAAPTAVGSGGAAGAAGAVGAGVVSKAVSAVVVTGIIGGALWVGTRQPHRPPTDSSSEINVQAETKSAPQPVPPAPPQVERHQAPVPVASTIEPEHRPSVVTTQAKPKPASTAAAEAQILERARALMKTNPEQALSVTQEHARLYPKGVLAQERDVITIEALRRLGRGSEANSRVEAFEREYPGSAHQRSIKRGTAEN